MADSNCNDDCSLEAGYMCGGGASAHSVYITEAVSCPVGTVVQGASPGELSCALEQVTTTSYQYMGCYKDNCDNRKMVGMPGDRFSVTGCIRRCREEGYRFAGLQWYSQCYCGNAEDYLYYEDVEAVCDRPCTEHGRINAENMICGGSCANSVYATGL